MAPGMRTANSGAEQRSQCVPRYDLNADQIAVTGVVREFPFINPHVCILIDVTGADSTVAATGFPARKGNGVDTEEIIVGHGVLVC